MSKAQMLAVTQTTAGLSGITYDIDESGRGLANHTVQAVFTPSGGTGCLVGQTSAGGVIQATPAVLAGGSGYTVGDVLTVLGGNGDGRLLVATLTGTAVATVTISVAGTGYLTGSNFTTSATAKANTGMSALTIVLQGSLDKISWYDMATLVILPADLIVGNALWSIANKPAFSVRTNIQVFAPNGSATPNVSIYHWNGGS